MHWMNEYRRAAMQRRLMGAAGTSPAGETA
jgi:hypothetical protein